MALGRVLAPWSRARPRGPGLRSLWGCGLHPEVVSRRRALGWGWRRSSSTPEPGTALGRLETSHYQLAYTCKVGVLRERLTAASREGRGRPGRDSAVGVTNVLGGLHVGWG